VLLRYKFFDLWDYNKVMLETEGSVVVDPEETSLVIVGEDSLGNANKAKAGIDKAFPEATFSIISDPEQIRSISPQILQNGNVLVRVVIPKKNIVNTVDLMRTWSESLNRKE
jgi:hypothetical protein